MPVGTGADLGGERRQQCAEQGGVDAIGDEPHDLAGGGPDEAVQIEPLVAVMAAGGRAASTWRPDLAQDRLQSEAVFIERPDFNRDRRVGALEFGDASSLSDLTKNGSETEIIMPFLIFNRNYISNYGIF